jgi:hypothetical protein
MTNGMTKDAALRQCVDFELMAQAAERHGLASVPDVLEAMRAAMVSQLVAKVYEDGFQHPADFGAAWEPLVEKNRWRVKHENYRGSAYVRVPLDETKATPADVEAARAIADQIAAAVVNERGLLGPQLVELAQRAAPTTKLDHENVPPYRAGKLDDNYAAALFAIPEVGRTAPKAVRTKWGWDVILFTEDVPATDPPADEIAAKLLPDAKVAYFNTWVASIAKQLGIHVVLDQANVAKLEALQ